MGFDIAIVRKSYGVSVKEPFLIYDTYKKIGSEGVKTWKLL